jgi:hypothetical protein
MSLPFTAQTAYASAEEICFNGIDDDADALVDCDDPECQPGYFKKSSEELGDSDSHNVALGDLDGDGDIDAFVANKNGQANTVWINQGGIQGGTEGVFVHDYDLARHNLGSSDSMDCQLADLDGDLDLDAFVVNTGQPNRIWLNDGAGNFTDSGQALGSSKSHGVEMGDLNGDHYIDAFVVNVDEPNRVWTNDGSGVFTDGGQGLGVSASLDVALGDIDSDGDLDAYVANGAFQYNILWINQWDGQTGTLGLFEDSKQDLGASNSQDVALEDLDGDGDLDAVVVNLNQSNYVWINEDGDFSQGQELGVGASWGVDIGDLDGDQWPDVFIANYDEPHRVWFNNQNGSLSDSGQALGQAISSTVVLEDVDSDGDLDAFVTNMQANHVWINNMVQACGSDLDGDGIPNQCDLDLVIGADCDQDGQVDSCQPDSDGDGLIDPCDSDLDGDGVPNDCDLDQTPGDDCDLDGQVDACQADTDTDGTIDPCDDDLDGDGVPNDCDTDQTAGPDCDGNGTVDECDPDVNANGIPEACEVFRRGDVNTDSSVNIADPITLIYFVLGASEISCVDAADVNDNGDVNIVDIVHLLMAIMDGAPAIPDPGPINCGTDPTADTLMCDSYDGC